MNRKDGLITSTNQDVECFGRGRVRGSVLANDEGQGVSLLAAD